MLITLFFLSILLFITVDIRYPCKNNIINSDPCLDDRQCNLCSQTPSNAICLVNTLSDSVTPLPLFTPHHSIPNQIEDIEKYTYNTLFTGDCFTANADPKHNKLTVSIDTSKSTEKTLHKNKTFCKDCAEKLNGLKLPFNLALADIYDMENIKVYPIIKGHTVNIRHYKCKISSKINTLKLYITSSYNKGGNNGVE